MFTTCIFLLFSMCSIRLVTPVSIRGMTDNKPGHPYLTEYNEDKRSGVRSEGIFERFVRNYLDVLSTGFRGKDLKKYIRVVQKELKKMEYPYTEKLSKHFKDLSKMDRENIQGVMAGYREEYELKPPCMQEFLNAMNDVFTMQQNLQFDDYIYDLKDYAGNLKYSMQEETRKLLNDVILNNIFKLSQHDKRELEKKLRHAIKEYRHGR